MGPGIRVAPVADEEREAVADLLASLWGGETMVIHDEVFRLTDLPAITARDGDEVAGVATYRVDGGVCELVSLDSLRPGRGIGTALLRAVEEAALKAGCGAVRTVTTNDNVDALRFYQRRGYRMVAVDLGAVDRARRLKPTIPSVGHHGIPIRDEVMLERTITPAPRVR